MKRVLPVALMLLLFSPAVYAIDFYVGASAGSASLEVDEDSFEFDESDTSYKAFAGMNFGRLFGLEVAYVDFGNPADSDADVDVGAVTAFGMINLNLGERFKAFGKAGAYSWDVEVDGDNISGDDDGTDFAWGVGASFKLTKRLTIRGEYESFTVDEDLEVDVGMVSLGLEIHLFGR